MFLNEALFCVVGLKAEYMKYSTGSISGLSSGHCLSVWVCTFRAEGNKQDKMAILIIFSVDIAEGRLSDVFH